MLKDRARPRRAAAPPRSHVPAEVSADPFLMGLRWPRLMMSAVQRETLLTAHLLRGGDKMRACLPIKKT